MKLEKFLESNKEISYNLIKEAEKILKISCYLFPDPTFISTEENQDIIFEWIKGSKRLFIFIQK